MLEAAKEYAEAKGVKVELRHGSSYDLDGLSERFRLVAMGRSFHWMDRAATLEALDRIIEPGGAVVLFGDTHPKLPQNRWRERFKSVLEPYAEKDPNPVRMQRKEGKWVGHEAFLLDSRFDRLDVLG